MDEFCAHRGVSLWFGRNEENGLRCPYHGWKYDVTGQCIDVPSEPVENGFCQKIKLASYRCVELGGVMWTYMGPPEEKPRPPEFEWTHGAAGAPLLSKRLQECNYLQAHGRRHRLRPRVVPASRRLAATRCSRAPRRRIQ